MNFRLTLIVVGLLVVGIEGDEGETECHKGDYRFGALRDILRYWIDVYKRYEEEFALGYCWAEYFLDLGALTGMESRTSLKRSSSAAGPKAEDVENVENAGSDEIKKEKVGGRGKRSLRSTLEGMDSGKELRNDIKRQGESRNDWSSKRAKGWGGVDDAELLESVAVVGSERELSGRWANATSARTGGGGRPGKSGLTNNAVENGLKNGDAVKKNVQRHRDFIERQSAQRYKPTRYASLQRNYSHFHGDSSTLFNFDPSASKRPRPRPRPGPRPPSDQVDTDSLNSATLDGGSKRRRTTVFPFSSADAFPTNQRNFPQFSSNPRLHRLPDSRYVPPPNARPNLGELAVAAEEKSTPRPSILSPEVEEKRRSTRALVRSENFDNFPILNIQEFRESPPLGARDGLFSLADSYVRSLLDPRRWKDLSLRKIDKSSGRKKWSWWWKVLSGLEENMRESDSGVHLKSDFRWSLDLPEQPKEPFDGYGVLHRLRHLIFEDHSRGSIALQSTLSKSKDLDKNSHRKPYRTPPLVHSTFPGKSSVNAVEAKREGVDEDDSGIFMIGRTEEITSNIDGRSREQKSFEASFDPAYRTIETWGEYEQSTWRTEDRANNDRLDDSPRESLIRVSTIKDNTVAPRSSVPSRKLKKSRNQRLQRLKRDNYKVIANRVSARGGRSKEKFYNGSSVFKGELPGTFKIEKENWPRTNDNSTREKFRREIRERGTPYEKRGEVFRAFPGKLKKDWRNGEVLKSGKSLKADIEFRDEDGKYDKLMSARRGRERMQGDENSLRESWRSLAGGVSRAPRRRRAYRYGFPFSKDSFFEKEQKDLARCSTASTCDPAGSVDVERDSSPGFTEDYQESTVNSDPGHPSNTSSIKINEIQPTSSYSSLINFNFPSQLVAFAKLLRLLILVGRRAMESIETNSFLACTRNYLSLKLASWLE